MISLLLQNRARLVSGGGTVVVGQVDVVEAGPGRDGDPAFGAAARQWRKGQAR